MNNLRIRRRFWFLPPLFNRWGLLLSLLILLLIPPAVVLSNRAEEERRQEEEARKAEQKQRAAEEAGWPGRVRRRGMGGAERWRGGRRGGAPRKWEEPY
jgi:hypothetical protein